MLVTQERHMSRPIYMGKLAHRNKQSQVKVRVYVIHRSTGKNKRRDRKDMQSMVQSSRKKSTSRRDRRVSSHKIGLGLYALVN